MAERKWGAITSGATFESLATTIVFFEDPKASLFGRRGKDGGQDARSGDGTLVFQAKHHENGSAAAAIRDAKNEAEKVDKYRQPGHSRYEQWKGVTHWRLVTNAVFNPTDEQTWKTDVVPLFAKQGLTADYWERATLDGLLDKHPEIHRSFFENETRVFLSVPEARDRLPSQEPFLRRDELAPFCGRAAEIAKVRDFLGSSYLFLVVHGAGGTGKTRLLLEVGESIASEGTWQVLWTNVASMATTGAWFEAVTPETPTLLLVDEPSDELVLEQLAEQLGGRVGRTALWKVVVTVRSPKDPVLRFLRGARMKPRVEELALEALPAPDAEAMCFELLKVGTLASLPEEARRNAAHELSKRFSRFPVWLTLAVQHLEDHGNLNKIPTDAEQLADEYLQEVEQGQAELPPDSVRSLLRWVALLGTLNREDDGLIKLVGDGSGAGTVVEARRRLESLVRRRALIERGARNRMIELKPDVLRDHVLRRWLVVEVGGAQAIVPSDDAKALLDLVRNATLTGGLSGLGRAVLVSLVRTEFLFRLAGNDIHLVADLFLALEEAVPAMTASQRIALADVLEAVASYFPRAAASLAALMRRSTAPDETVKGIFGARHIGHDDVVLSLAWPLFSGAMGADAAEEREAVLREMCALAEAEAELAPNLPRGLPNDGKRAGALVTRVLEGGPQFSSEYDDTAMKLASELLDALTRNPPTRGQVALLQALVQPVLALERRQSWSDDKSVSWRTFAIAPGSSSWAARDDLFARLKSELAADAMPLESRVQLWHVFAEAHRNVNQLCRRVDGDPYYASLLDNLTWTHGVLATHGRSVEELAAAREVWSWHYRFEKDPKLKAAAIELEKLYAANDLANEFEPLLSRDDVKQTDARVSAKVAELAGVSEPGEISGFVDRAVSFLGAERELYRLADVAWQLGEYAESRAAIQQFVTACLQQPTVTPRVDFGAIVAVRWVAGVRLREPARAAVVVKDLLAHCGSDEQRANLLLRMYGRVPKRKDVGEFTADEHALLRGARSLFTNAARDVPYIAALALTVKHEWPVLRPVLEEVLRAVPHERLPGAMNVLVDAIYWAVEEDNSMPAPTGLAEWLMNQLLVLPNFEELGDEGEWHLGQILDRLGHVDVKWLPGALARRQQQEATRGEDRARAISYHARVSKYVRKLGALDVADSGIRDVLDKLLEFAGDNSTVGYYLPDVLHDVDSEGLLVPDAIAAKVKTASTPEDVSSLARIGGAYSINSTSWRTIALASIRAAAPHGPNVVASVYRALHERGVRSWSGAVGEVSPIFPAAVDEARAALDAEVEADLRPFWQTRLTSAEAELRDQEERAKEARGE